MAVSYAEGGVALMDWFKAYQDGLLRGSLARTDHTTQLIWVKLLAVVNETRCRDGWLHYKPGEPISRDYLATVCNVTREELDYAIMQFQTDLDVSGQARVIVSEDGTVFVKNWEKYQAKPDRLSKKEVAVEKAKETRRRQDSTAMAQVRLTNELQVAIRTLQGEVAIPVQCPFCEVNGIGDMVTLARHIDQAGDDAHFAGLGWAREYLKK